MFHISNIIAQQLYEYPLRSTKSLTDKTYPLASCQCCKNEMAPVAEVT